MQRDMRKVYSHYHNSYYSPLQMPSDGFGFADTVAGTQSGSACLLP